MEEVSVEKGIHLWRRLLEDVDEGVLRQSMSGQALLSKDAAEVGLCHLIRRPKNGSVCATE